ncbi:MAG: pseudouridine synthase [Rhodospirillaceae bacterium]|nr:pseudouridine synthase [Rhodospirillaceae bacterium]
MSGQKTAHPGERIAKVMARAGLCSRRDAEGWITAGRVSVNGKKLTSAAVNVLANDIVLVDGKPLPDKEGARVWLYYKPKGLMTTSRDPEGRPTVFERLPPEMPRVISIGRLDLNSEGLLLLTNDGELARRLELPSTAWVRRYRVRVNGRIDPKILDQVKTGITIEGVRYGPIEAAVDRQQGANAWITMGLTEGKNREIRRICQHFGWPVSRLIRISYGPFQLGEMEPGQVTEVKGKLLKDQLKFGNEWKPELSKALPPVHVQAALDERKKQAAGHYPEARKRWSDKSAPGPREADRRESGPAKAERERPRGGSPHRADKPGKFDKTGRFERPDKFKKPDKFQTADKSDRPGRFDEEARKLAARIDSTLKRDRALPDGPKPARSKSASSRPEQGRKPESAEQAAAHPVKAKRRGPRNAGQQKPKQKSKRDANRFR